MARRTTSTPQYMQGADSTLLRPAFPMAVGGWYKGGAQGSFNYLLSKLLTPGDHVSYGFSTDGGGALRFLIGWGAGAGQVTISPTIAQATAFDDAWHHILGTYDGTTIRIYLDGVEQGAGTAENRAIAYAAQDLFWYSFDGAILFCGALTMAEWALWSVVPDAGQRAALAAAYSPQLIAPAGLLEYWPLIGRFSPEIGVAGGTDLTVNSVGQADHPRIFLPTSSPIPIKGSSEINVVSEGVGHFGFATAGESAKTIESEGVGHFGMEGSGASSHAVPLTALNFLTMVTGIGQCAADGLQVDSVGGLPCRVCVAIAGSIAADDCGCTCGELGDRNGQLAVTVAQIYPSSTLWTSAVDDGRQSRCGVPHLVAEIHVQIHRCVHTLDDAGNAPSCEQLLQDAVIWHSDAAAIRKAVGCCVREMRAAGTIRDFAIGATTPLGEEGGCTGSDLRVLIAIKNCLCPD